MADFLLSVGIDIGTSTTQLIFSKLFIKNIASASSVPRHEIVDKEIIYKSKIHFTPLKSATEIDVTKALEIIKEEYKNAGISTSEPDTGAVIITGETARKENARAVLQALSDFSGDFVVATAGADLEGVLSGKGAGTDKISDERHCVALNFDIGGGTTNISVFNRGSEIDTACFDIGGRLIKYENNIITYISPKLKEIIKNEGFDIAEKQPFSSEKTKPLLKLMVDVLCDELGLKQSKYYNLLITNKGLSKKINPDFITFSGGVAKAIYEKENNPFVYGDIGVLLAEEILNSDIFKSYNVIMGNETIRATVVGAGSHTTEVSGSTIFYDENSLPIKNLSVLKIENESNFKEEFERKIKRFDTSSPLAVALNGKSGISYQDLKNLASHIYDASHSLAEPIVIIFNEDMAKSFGYIFKSICDKKIIIIDGISLKDEDFIDIGSPTASGEFLPVVIKTLLFQ